MQKNILVCVFSMVLSIASINLCYSLEQVTYVDTSVSLNIERAVYDEINDNYWLWSMSPFTDMTYDEQIFEINDLTYFGMNNWSMANQEQMNSLFSQIPSEDVLSFYFDYSQVEWGTDDYTHLSWGTYVTETVQTWDYTILGRYDQSTTDMTAHGTAGSYDQQYIDHVNYGGLFGYDTLMTTTGLYRPDMTNYELDTIADVWLGAWVVAAGDGRGGSNNSPPVPEPATIFLLGLGLFALTAVNRKKIKTA